MLLHRWLNRVVIIVLTIFVLLIIRKPVLEQILPYDVQIERIQALHNNWQLAKAGDLAGKLYRRFPDHTETIRLYGNILLDQGELHEARQVFENLREIEADFRDDDQLQLAFIDYFLGNLNSADSLAADVKIRVLKTGEIVHQANAYHILGRIEFNRSNFDRSMENQKKSLQLAHAASDEKGIADALRQMGVLYWYRGDAQTARGYYDKALELYRQIKDKPGEATVISNIGHLYNDYDWQLNLQNQLIAYDIRKRTGDQVGLADSYYFLAQLSVFDPSSNFLRHHYFKRSFDLSEKIGYQWGREHAFLALEHHLETEAFSYRTDYQVNNEIRLDSDIPIENELEFGKGLSKEGELQLLIGRARYQSNRGNHKQAAFFFKEAFNRMEEQQYQLYYLPPLRNYARSLIMMDSLAIAENTLQKGLELAYEHKNEMQIPAFRYYLAVVYHQTDRTVQAKEILIDVVEHYDDTFYKILEESHHLSGFQSAVNTMQHWRSKAYRLLIDILFELEDPGLFDFIERERSLPFWSGMHAVSSFENDTANKAVEEFVRLLLDYDRSPRGDRSIQPVLLAIEEVQQATISQRRQIQESYSGHARHRTFRAQELQEVLYPGEVFVSWFVSDKKIYAHVVRKEFEKAIEINGSDQQLRTITEVYLNMVLRGYNNSADELWRASSHNLYSKLFEPLLSDSLILPDDRVIISPHKNLHLIPFHALPIALTGDRYVIDEHIISYVPSATVFTELRNRELKPLQSCLAIAPDKNSLPFSYLEVKDIPDELFSFVDYLIEKEATGNVVLEQFQYYDAIHISSHAMMDFMFPLASYIGMADRNLRLHEFFGSAINTRLIILSSCGSGRGVGTLGRIPEGFDMMSFPRVFLEAGASTVMATLWMVEDETAMHIMKLFYEELYNASLLSDSTNLAEALANAQRKFLNQARLTGENTHPFYWAPFVLFGETEQTTALHGR